MRHRLALLACFLLTACGSIDKKVVSGPVAGLEYRNQNTAPWPWVSVVPSERALALKEVDFDLISQQMHFDMAFAHYKCALQDVRVVVLDYTILPEEVLDNRVRPQRYFMVASFYKIGKRPPCPPDFEISTTMLRVNAPPHEAVRFMARDVMDEIRALYNDGLLTPGRKIMINLDH